MPPAAPRARLHVCRAGAIQERIEQPRRLFLGTGHQVPIAVEHHDQRLTATATCSRATSAKRHGCSTLPAPVAGELEAAENRAANPRNAIDPKVVSRPCSTPDLDRRLQADLAQLETRLWDAADELRANSGLKASEYGTPVLGLIFLRFADAKFKAASASIEGKASARRKIGPSEYHAQRVIYVTEAARFDYLLSLPEGADLGRACSDLALFFLICSAFGGGDDGERGVVVGWGQLKPSFGVATVISDGRGTGSGRGRLGRGAPRAVMAIVRAGRRVSRLVRGGL